MPEFLEDLSYDARYHLGSFLDFVMGGLRKVWILILRIIATIFSLFDKDMSDFFVRSHRAIYSGVPMTRDDKWWMTKAVKQHEALTGKPVKSACKFFWLAVYYLPLERHFRRREATVFAAIAIPGYTIVAIALYLTTKIWWTAALTAFVATILIAVVALVPEIKEAPPPRENKRSKLFFEKLEQGNWKQRAFIILSHPLLSLMLAITFTVLFPFALLYWLIINNGFCPTFTENT